MQQLASIARGFVAKKGSILPSRAPTANLGLVAAVAVCVGVGYVLGNTFPWSRSAGQDGLRATTGEDHNPRTGVAPGPLGEPEDMRPLAGQFFLTAAYEQIEPAGAAARTLRQGGLGKARLRQLPLGIRRRPCAGHVLRER